MKLRIKGNSLRLRVSRSELDRLVAGESLEDTIRFSPEPQAKLTYALEVAAGASSATVRYSQHRIAVVVGHEELRIWNQASQVGVYAGVEVCADELLELSIEKDFACLDRSDEENEDTFANPLLGCVLTG